MNVAYVDCFSGASGDMLLGAVVSAGAPIEELRDGLALLPLTGYRLEARQERRGVIAGTKVDVLLEEERGPRRSLGDIEALLGRAGLPHRVADRAVAVFRRLAQVEAGIHGLDVPDVHFHEVGAVDAIVDVVGVLLGLELLGVDECWCSPLPMAGGYVASSHGVLPLPAPATLGLLAEANAPLVPPPAGATDIGETVTPTAAALLTTVARFGQPSLVLQRVGYGLGTRDHPRVPNVLRLWVGTAPAVEPATREIRLLETNIDDMNPEFYAHVADLLFQAGALDVWCTPLQMKKNRPGTQISVLSLPEQAVSLAALMLRETSTLGVRFHSVRRWEAEREVLRFESSLGPAAVKVKRWEGEIASIAPEYEACRALAQRHNLPLSAVYRRVEEEAWRRFPSVSGTPPQRSEG